MVTELETKTKTQSTHESRRIFSGLESSASADYKRPSFSTIDFDVPSITNKTEYDLQARDIEVAEQKQTDMLVVEKAIEQKPEKSLKIKLNSRGKIIVTVLAICICALLTFMIANIVTISSLNGTISAKQNYISSQQSEVDKLRQEYDEILNNLETTAGESGYQQIDPSQIVEYNGSEIINKPTTNIESNWFDKLCNFFAQLFN